MIRYIGVYAKGRAALSSEGLENPVQFILRHPELTAMEVRYAHALDVFGELYPPIVVKHGDEITSSGKQTERQDEKPYLHRATTSLIPIGARDAHTSPSNLPAPSLLTN